MTKKNMLLPPLMIEGTNVSEVWAKIFLHVIDNSGTEISPLILTVCDLDKHSEIHEDNNLRNSLDNLLAHKEKISVENVAFTIFPERYWLIAGQDRTKLFSLYKNTYGRIQARDSRNRRGLYFARMTMYGRGPCDGNQLEWIISQYRSRKGVRRSMFQATVFDAGVDHNATALIGFPCLQHVSFEPTSSGLVVNAFYATQKIFEKAYGNYLGLIQLGKFMAQEFEMPLARLNVMVGIAKLDTIPKSDGGLAQVIDDARSLISSENGIQTQVA